MTDNRNRQRPDLSRRRTLAVRLGMALFIIGTAAALAVTFGGARELVNQVMSAPDGKSGLITIILGFGFVLLGPVLLLALAMLTPRQWIPATFTWIAHFFQDSRHVKPRGHAGSR
jgi:hypothetical protein